MLHITLSSIQHKDPEKDELGRSWVGYSEDKSIEELYEQNRGCWVLGARADRERYALFSYRGIVKFAIAIDGIEPTPTRRALVGTILELGDPVYDQYVDKESPVSRVRNPITYFDASADRRECACGCGQPVARGYFVPGHDQRAIHERVARVGSVVDFLHWFDAHYPEAEASHP